MVSTGPDVTTGSAAAVVPVGPSPRRKPLGHRMAEAWYSLVFAPRGDGQTKRRGSDGLKLGAAVLIVLCCWLIAGANSNLEKSVAHFLFPAPEGVRWVVAVVWTVGSLGVIAFLVLTALVSRRREIIRDVALAGLASWGISALLQVVLGAHGGRPPTSAFSGFDLTFPLAQVAATLGVVAAALPYLSRLLQRVAKVVIVLLAVATVIHGSGLPASVLASIAIGWGVAAAVHLTFGSSLGLPSSEEVLTLLGDLGIVATDLGASPRQVWGVARFQGADAAGPLDVSVYGRDAVDAQFLNKLYRFVVYRDSGPTLTLTRTQQVEHEAYLTLMAERSGAHVPSVVAAAPTGPANDAVLVTRPPVGTRLADLGADTALENGALDDCLTQLLVLRKAGIAHGSISSDTIIIGPEGTAGLTDLRNATFVGASERSDNDVAAALAALALKVGAERTIASAMRVLPSEVVAKALPRLQAAALDPVSARDLRGSKPLLAELRAQGAAATGVEVPKLAETRRMSGMNLVLVGGSLIGGYALIGVLLNVSRSFSTIRGAEWGWVIGAFVLAQLTYPALAYTMIGSTMTPLAFGRVVALEVSNSFVSLAIPMGPLAMRVRFFQKQGSDVTSAVSSGAVASSVSWVVKGALFAISIPLLAGSLHLGKQGGKGGHSHLVWLVAIIILAVAVLLGVVLAVPRLRRVARAKLAPTVTDVWKQVKTLLIQPRKLAEMVGGAIAAQLLIVFCLGAALHAFGDHLPIATLIVVLTAASMLGGVSPVPGGMGVVEAGMILGLTSAGLSQTHAVAATFIQRAVTAYLPPIWGWATLVWIRRKDYI
ncbi:MAG TPA: lysylphosphatidylglycerol synthase transmembrane domain-containing protein [Acidimicrobiales bacterium]|jgi:uncharacterized membrane protein YbhN (UPF0104 family)|nr:lysylphosphatidylglycerol synthase transmembrane domain-containing protein [Acidimicrobiales bacterium]